MSKLSVVIITFNEEKNILRCLDSVRDIADEVVVIDSNSTDKTIQLCEQQGCRVFTRKFDFHAKQKQYAVNQATYDWIFSIDADEILSDELKIEIGSLFEKVKLPETDVQPENSGYIIPRRLFYMGHRMMMSGADKTIRLFDRRKARFALVPIHEYVKVDGPVGSLKGKIIHYSYRDIAHHIETINSYTSYAAEGYKKANKSFSKFWVFLKFPVTFFIHYIIRGGILDGYPGFMWSFFAAFHTSVKIAKTIEMVDKS
jgi:glycosyltransferase involved in cell wall biosynthesis